MRASIYVLILFVFGLVSSASLPRLDEEAVFGTLAFVGSPLSNPISIPVEAGGETAASELNLGHDCRGWIDASAPSLRLDFQQSDAVDLELQVEADVKNSLIINSSDGRWYCVQANSAHKSAIRLLAPNTGQIDIWVGLFQEQKAPTTVTVRAIAPR